MAFIEARICWIAFRSSDYLSGLLIPIYSHMAGFLIIAGGYNRQQTNTQLADKGDEMERDSRKSRERLVRHQAVSLLFVAVLALLMAVFAAGLAGCGDDEKQETSSNGVTAKTGTSSATSPAGNTGMDTTVEVPPSPKPSPEPSPAPEPVMPLRIIDYNVVPNTVSAGAPLACTVTVEGEATAVIMGLTGPSGSVSQTVNLIPGPTSGGVTTWSAVTTAPPMVGGWRFGARAIAADGTEVLPDAGGLSASLLPFEVVP